MTLPLWALAALGAATFLLGVVVGLMFREAVAIARTGHTRLMASVSRRRPPGRIVGITIVTLAVIANGASGFLTIANGRSDNERSVCSVRFNEQQQAALDERGVRGAQATESEIALWLGISEQLTPGGDLGAVRAAIADHVESLRESQASRVENPYPPADLCRVDP